MDSGNQILSHPYQQLPQPLLQSLQTASSDSMQAASSTSQLMDQQLTVAITALRAINAQLRTQKCKQSDFADQLKAIASMLARVFQGATKRIAFNGRVKLLEGVAGISPVCKITLDCMACRDCATGGECSNESGLIAPVVLMSHYCMPIMPTLVGIAEIYQAAHYNHPWDQTCGGEVMTFGAVIEAMRILQTGGTIEGMTDAELTSFMAHYEQANRADVDKPIMMYEDAGDNCHIGDGYHRLCKAIIEELPSIGVYVLTWAEMYEMNIGTVDWHTLCSAVTNPYTAWARKSFV